MAKKSKKVGKNRQDRFYHLAKEQGFRSRASFKLVQLNKRHDFLSTAARGVIDLCAAPGGWMQIARKHMPVNAPCVGIDLVPIRSVPGCISVQGDITSDQTKSQLKHALTQSGGHDKVDAVLNDGSPNMGKAWLQDAYTQSELTLAALKLASEFLAPGGTFVTKVFRSNDYNSLLFVMNQLFDRVSATKPSASRAESAEIYVMCLGFKAPKHIDARLLNPKHVFKDLATAESDGAKPDLILNTVLKNMKAAKRNRSGYELGNLTLFSRVSALHFCRSTRPVAMVVAANQVSFDVRDISHDSTAEDSHQITELLEEMPETTEDVKHCMRDLKVLARRDFKLILRWRSAARQKLMQAGLLDKKSESDSGTPLGGEQEDHPSQPEDCDGSDHPLEKPNEISDSQEECLDDEIKRARADHIAKTKRKRRKLNKTRAALQRKVDMKIVLPDQNFSKGDSDPSGLFSLNTASSLLEQDTPVDAIPVVVETDGYEAEADDVPRIPYSIKESDAGREAMIEDDLDRWYNVYLSRKKKDKNGATLESKERRRVTKRRALRDSLAGESDPMMDDHERELRVNSSESSASENEEEDGTVPPKHLHSRDAALWFAQPLFHGVTGDSDDSATEKDKESSRRDEEEWSSADENGDAIYSFHKAAAREASANMEQSGLKSGEGDFDVVPAEGVGTLQHDVEESTDDAESFHSSDYDTDEKAEMIAIAKKTRHSKKVSDDVLEEAYNRYTFDDPNDLPGWFADPDTTYRQRQSPVTKEQVAEMKEYIKSLQNAPTKKEAEAKARRRARTSKRMEAVKAKATGIAEQVDVSANSRMKAIENLYKQALKSGKRDKQKKPKVYQVVRPNGRVAVGKGNGGNRKRKGGVHTVLVDKRLKSDKRGFANAQKRNNVKQRQSKR